MLDVCHPGHPAVRHTAWRRPGRVADFALQPVEPRRIRPRRGPAPVRRARRDPSRTVTVVFANIFQPLIDVFEAVLKFFHNNVGLTWGMSIIAMTVVVRAAILPLTLRQMKSMRRMQELSPKIKELQAKYKGDKQRQNEEMMKFYRENQVNPLGSCLPLLLQLPVFLSLFYMLRRDLKLDICGPAAAIEKIGPISTTPCEKVDPGSAQFLFIPDLTDKATGSVLVVLILLYVGTQLASSVLMSVSADPMQRRLMMVLPLIFVAFIINFPAGLIV